MLYVDALLENRPRNVQLCLADCGENSKVDVRPSMGIEKKTKNKNRLTSTTIVVILTFLNQLISLMDYRITRIKRRVANALVLFASVMHSNRR